MRRRLDCEGGRTAKWSQMTPLEPCSSRRLIPILMRLVGHVEQDASIADELFFARHADIHGTARQMVRGRYAAHLPVQARASDSPN